VLFIEDVAYLLFWLLAAVVAINVLFLWSVLERRVKQRRYFVIKDAAREGWRGRVRAFVDGRLELEDMLSLRSDIKSPPARDALHELLFAIRTPASATRISELLFALRSVDGWAVRAFGRRRAKRLVEAAIRRSPPPDPAPRNRFVNALRRLKVFAVPRAIAVNKLGQLAPEFAQVFLVDATSDPAREVRQVAVMTMGAARYPPFIPPLMQELARSIEQENDVSWRTLTIALTSFRLADVSRFVPFLSHPHPRMRFTIVDIIRQIAGAAARDGLLNKNDFSPELYTAFLDRVVVDEFADVRARSAPVVAHFRDARALRALRTLLNDPNDFVRLHAVRAAADRFYSDLLPDLTRRLRDPHWRVREAAVKAMLPFGSAGLDALFRTFLQSDDDETVQQITDGLQRVGAMPTLLASLTTDGLQSSLASAVCQKMAAMGKTVYLNRALASVDDEAARLSLMDALMVAPDDEYLGVLQSLADSGLGVVSARASEILQKSAIMSQQESDADA
jgi:HEAT repeat protein